MKDIYLPYAPFINVGANGTESNDGLNVEIIKHFEAALNFKRISLTPADGTWGGMPDSNGTYECSFRDVIIFHF